MKENLNEEEMRQALFGSVTKPSKDDAQDARITSEQQHVSKPRKVASSRSPKLRVTLRVTAEFEGEPQMLTYDASTLSTLIAEQEAKAEARKQKYKYFELVSIESI
ncbi:hypothetical protein ACI7YU_18360 [Pseudomonas siliginis]|uniref:hypothetical protein n=1 Tax=Pseudomonas siliginis TaxID=2842346 RepID=UPI0038703903